ncbi:MAG: hypothetical protein WA194_03625 [Patescibacteria group bacterium]
MLADSGKGRSGDRTESEDSRGRGHEEDRMRQEENHDNRGKHRV